MCVSVRMAERVNSVPNLMFSIHIRIEDKYKVLQDDPRMNVDRCLPVW